MSNDEGYVQRSYRSLHGASDLQYFNVRIRESDLAIGVEKQCYSDSLVHLCRKELIRVRGDLEDYISLQPEFKSSLVPVAVLPGAPEIVCRMGRAAMLAGVGPMAAVAGAVAQSIGEKLSALSEEIIIENGGDIFLRSRSTRVIAVFAGKSKFSCRIGIKVDAEETPLGICTSSGTVGHSLSFGKADAVVIKAPSAALADAVATGAGNLVKTRDDLMLAVDYVKKIAGVEGILVIKEDGLAAWGRMEILPISRREEHESGE